MEKAGNILRKSIGYLKTHLNREIAFYIVLTVVALIMRMWNLGARAVHYDEGIHLGCSWNIFDPFGWCLQAWTHGPFQFIGTAASFAVFGESDFSARLLPALFGTAIVALPYFLRRQLGRWGAMAVAVLLAFSPLLMYYSRYARNDIYIVFFTLLLIVCIWNYIDSRKSRWLYTGVAALSLSFCAKEVTYINFSIIALFLIVYCGRELASRVRHRVNLRDVSPQSDFLILIGTLSLPLFAGFVNLLPHVDLGRSLSNPWAIAILAILFIASAAVGLRWNPRRWLISALIFYGIFILTYSIFFQQNHGLAVGLWGNVAYWVGEHDVARGGQPWYYYFMFLPVYEFLPLLFALLGGIYYAIKGNLFSRFLVCWAILSLAIYSFFGEKMPWLSVHIALPVIALGGMFIGHLLHGAEWQRNVRIIVRSLTAIAVLAMFSYYAYNACRESYQVEDHPPQMLMYAGISSEVPRIVSEIEAFAEETGMGYDLPITIDSRDSNFDNGWRWHLRDYSNVFTPNMSTISSEPQGWVLILTAANEAVAAPYLGKYGEGERIYTLIWFPEEYKNKFSIGWWWGYFLHRETDGSIWHRDAIVYFLEGEPPEQ